MNRLDIASRALGHLLRCENLTHEGARRAADLALTAADRLIEIELETRPKNVCPHSSTSAPYKLGIIGPVVCNDCGAKVEAPADTNCQHMCLQAYRIVDGEQRWRCEDCLLEVVEGKERGG